MGWELKPHMALHMACEFLKLCCIVTVMSHTLLLCGGEISLVELKDIANHYIMHRTLLYNKISKPQMSILCKLRHCGLDQHTCGQAKQLQTALWMEWQPSCSPRKAV